MDLLQIFPHLNAILNASSGVFFNLRAFLYSDEARS
jgi:hypothetical protein